MSKTKATQPAGQKAQEKKHSEPFRIKYPLLWLVLAVLIVYAASIQFGFTELDDSIFIRELHQYNEDFSNLATSFRRGVFDPVKDTYYRPLFLNSIILNYQVSEQNIAGYHAVNLLLHLLSVMLVFQLFRKLKLNEINAFLLALVFAVHPVLSQAVVWIPGRNDTLMAVFILLFLIKSIDFSETGKFVALAISALSLLAAVFTKETALLAPGACFVLLVLFLKKSWKERPMLLQYLLWLAAIVAYFAVRSQATLKQQMLAPSQMLSDFVHRLPVLVQYIGKIFLPFNLSVFPIQKDTSYYFGIAAIVLLIVLILASKNKSPKLILAGFLWFILFLIPALFVPNNINEQVFEHRLYLPIIGILLVLSQTALIQNKLTDSRKIITGIGLAIILSWINYRHQQNFTDPLSFWKQAAATSPHSAYAIMMYGARVEDRQEGYALMRTAYKLNPNEKYLNYYYGVMLQNQDSILESEPYFLKEQKISDYFECDFYLAQIDHKKQNLEGAKGHLERYLTRDSLNVAANKNLLLLYIETRNKEMALTHITAMQRRGLAVPTLLVQQAQSLP